jgi:deoxyribonuclease-4
VIVHAGHAEDGIAEGVGRWPRTMEMLESEVPVLIENTAGGENAVARRFDALEMLWEALSAYDGPVELGFCFDTCHAHAAGEELSDAVERAIAITGRLDLLHANDSRDPPGTGADRHFRLGEGQVDTDALRHMIRAGATAGAPIVVETPGPRAGLKHDLAFVREALGEA